MTGVEVGVDVSQAEKIWRECTALGNIALACAYTFIAMDVQVRPNHSLSLFFGKILFWFLNVTKSLSLVPKL